MKKVINLVLILTTTLFVLASCGATGKNKFKDVKKTDWFYEDVSRACELNLINGRSETEFAPEENLTYAEAVKLAACMYQVYTKDESLVINGEPWYQVYVDYCREKKIIEKEYPWNESISRGAYMDIFSRALPAEALPVINTVDDGMIPDVNMKHPYAKSIYMLYRAGIVCGQDEEGNCVPDSFVKRSEVAAILTRMMDEQMRMHITLEDPDKIEIGGGSSSGKNPNRKPSDDEPEPEEPEDTELPWETGGKKPNQYTWSEFLALSEFQKQAFIDSFTDVDAFEAWMIKAQEDEANAKMPWEKGGKQPSKYTWAEFEALDDLQKEAFVESFGSNEAFEAWMEKAKNAEETEKMPWEKGGKQPQAYTWSEFEALTGDQKEAFIESFGSDEAFESWMQSVQEIKDNEDVPWEDGGKQPKDYTWAEFEDLTDLQKEAFVESFGSNEGFEAWMERAQQ